MTRRKVDHSIKLTRKITIRVSEPVFRKLREKLCHSNCRTLAELARGIVCKERIMWYHRDATLESTALALAGIRRELNAIGNNINQITRHFHTMQSPSQRNFQLLRALEEYKKVGEKVDQLLGQVSAISKTWLQK